MSAALQVFYSGFDTPFFKLPPTVQKRIEAKVDDMGLRLKTFPHHRLKGHDRYRLRVGDYRIIYTFDAERNSIRQSAGNLPGLLNTGRDEAIRRAPREPNA